MFFLIGMFAAFKVGHGYPILVGGLIDGVIYRKRLKEAYLFWKAYITKRLNKA